MTDAASPYWQMGFNVLNNLAGSGAFGSDGQKISSLINPPNPIAAPNPVPPPAPVAGQQSVNPAPTNGGHFGQHWGKYALAGGALLLLVVGVTMARR